MYNRRILIARVAEQHMAMFHTKEEGGTQEFNEWKEKQPEAFQEEWDENTEKYKDVVKNRAKQARFQEGDTAGWKAWMETQPEEFQEKWQDMNEEYGDVVKNRAKEMSKQATFSTTSPKYLNPRFARQKVAFSHLDAVIMKFQSLTNLFIKKETDKMEESLKSLKESLPMDLLKKAYEAQYGKPLDDKALQTAYQEIIFLLVDHGHTITKELDKIRNGKA